MISKLCDNIWFRTSCLQVIYYANCDFRRTNYIKCPTNGVRAKYMTCKLEIEFCLHRYFEIRWRIVSEEENSTDNHNICPCIFVR